MSWLQDPVKTAENYATDANLRARQALYRDIEGEPATAVLWRVMSELAPHRVLEVGGGPGELSQRMQDELAADVSYLDLSPGMVELAQARGVDARIGDVQALPFDDASFDTVVAAWMLYHVPDLDRGLAEIARVLETGGTLVAVTNSGRALSELRELMSYTWPGSTFSRENGEESLTRHFTHIERIDADTKITVHEYETLEAYRASIPAETRPIPADVELPFVTHSRVSIFLART